MDLSPDPGRAVSRSEYRDAVKYRRIISRRKAGTRKQAFAAARTLLDVAERRDSSRGEAIGVAVQQAEE